MTLHRNMYLGYLVMAAYITGPGGSRTSLGASALGHGRRVAGSYRMKYIGGPSFSNPHSRAFEANDFVVPWYGKSNL